MFNLTDEQAKQRYLQRHLLLSNNLERQYIIKLRKFFNMQYSQAASSVEHGNLRTDPIVDSTLSRFNLEITTQYLRVGKVFGDDVINSSISKKDPFDIYRERLISWIQYNAALRVVDTSDTTKKLIAGLIAKGQEEGMTNKEIATFIRSEGKISNPKRAITIAKTETHSAANASTDIAIKSLNITVEKEWMAAGGERTRLDHNIANGQRVPQDEPFDVGGEKLMYPGDTNGSAGNIVNCRCVVLYHT